MLRIAAAMKTSDHQQDVGSDDKKQRIRKYLKPSAVDILEYSGKLPRVAGDESHRTVDLGAKAATKASGFAFIPILRVDQLGACCQCETYNPHLWATLRQFRFERFPTDALRAVVIERRQAPLQFGLLRRGQRHVIIVQAFPKLSDEHQTFIRRKASDFVAG
jgi:hypothetical protein